MNAEVFKPKENSKPGVPPPEVLMGIPYLKNKSREDLLAITAEELQTLIDANSPEGPAAKAAQAANSTTVSNSTCQANATVTSSTNNCTKSNSTTDSAKNTTSTVDAGNGKARKKRSLSCSDTGTCGELFS